MDAKEQVKAKLDVAEVIGEYVTLKPAGSGSFKGVCPFHSERTPSFHVSRERQIWKCFGCDKGGDIFAFVMEMEGMNFVESLKHLAKRAGIELPEYRPAPGGNKEDVIFAINEMAAKYYQVYLRESPHAAKARSYVAERGITPEMQEKFRLGAAPNEWDSLALFLKKKGYSEQLLVDSGLCMKRKSGSGVIDRFRGRLMVPLCDASGKVVGFTARILPATLPPVMGGVGGGSATGGVVDDGPKYMNSPETPVYHKSHVLYGLHLAKSAARKAGEVIIVEGNLDVIASHFAGVENVVASSGTALTEDQLRTLARYTKRLIFCLDDDAAGFAAAKRVFDLALKLQAGDASLRFDVRCLVIPRGAGKDPDEVVKKDPEAWRKIVLHSHEIVEFYFEKTLRDFEGREDGATVQGRSKLVDDLLPQVARLARPDERHLYLLRLSDATHVSLAVLERMMQDLAKKSPIGASNTVPVVPTVIPLHDKPSATAAFLLGIVLRYDKMAKEIVTNVPIDTLKDPWKTLYRQVEIVYTAEQVTPDAALQKNLFSRLRAHLEQSGLERLIGTIDALTLRIDETLTGMSPQAVRAEVDRHLILFREDTHMQRRKALEAAIRHAEIAGDQERLRTLMEEYSSLITPRA